MYPAFLFRPSICKESYFASCHSVLSSKSVPKDELSDWLKQSGLPM